MLLALNSYFNSKAMMPLQDPDFFSQVSLDLKGRYIYWEYEIEFCADALRMKGKEIKSSITNYVDKELIQK